MSGPPLAGRPPFATDEPDSYYSSPSSSSSTPQQRTRFHIPSPHEERVNANKRTSAYDVYDNYLAAPSSSSGPSSSSSSSSSNPFANPTSSSSNNTSSNRDSGIGALLMSLDDSDSDSDSDESPAPRSKNAALAAAVSSNSNSSSGTGPTPNAHRHNPFTNPQGQEQGQQQQQRQRQSRNPFETPPLQVQSRGPAGQPQMQQQQQTQRTVLAAPQPGYAAPIAALNLGQLTASAGSMPVPPQAAMTRQQHSSMPGMSMPAPVSMPHPHPHQHTPKGPPSTLQINTSIPLPMPAHSPFTPLTPFTPGGAPFDPSRVASPHPLLPPVTPITPAFVRPVASNKGVRKGGGGAPPTPKPVGFDESVFGGKQGGGEEKERQSVETLDDEQGYPIPAPRRRGSGDGAGAGHGNAPGGAGGKGDEFWRRFSMVVKERERGRAAGKESSWLHETLSNSSRHTRSISVVAFFLVVLIAAGIGCGVYFTRNAPGHQQPKVFGGGAGNVATDTVGEGGATGKGGVGAGTKTVLHVSPTFTIDGRGWEEVGVVPTPTPAMMPTPAVSPTVVVVDEEKGRSNASSSSRNHGSEQQLKRWKRRHEGGWKNRLGLVLEEGVF
ncbi:hypothetical protein CPC08DRAFT_237770 [Agrocybe pediades]|nr:hypothetical protein CPC08DRAFT_237770 [Agrocybe pediades]